MALIECADCKNKISDRSEICPHCGCPTKTSIEESIKVNALKEFEEAFVCHKCRSTKFTTYTFVGHLMAKCTNCGEDEIIVCFDPNILKTEQPKCPYCHSTNTKKISGSSRVASFLTFGLASKKVGKQWHCNKCGSDF